MKKILLSMVAMLLMQFSFAQEFDFSCSIEESEFRRIQTVEIIVSDDGSFIEIWEDSMINNGAARPYSLNIWSEYSGYRILINLHHRTGTVVSNIVFDRANRMNLELSEVHSDFRTEVIDKTVANALLEHIYVID